jgi:hypothetical protein
MTLKNISKQKEGNIVLLVTVSEYESGNGLVEDTAYITFAGGDKKENEIKCKGYVENTISALSEEIITIQNHLKDLTSKKQRYEAVLNS